MTKVDIINFLDEPNKRFAATRDVGRKVRDFIEHQWELSENIVVSFEPDVKVTISFMDEAFAKLLVHHSIREFFDKLSFKNLSDYSKQLLAKVIASQLTRQ